MPFPLAHPAAVLPLRRFCPRWFNFPALVLGSLVPDAAYLFKRTGVDDLAHRFPGVWAFALPAAAALLVLMYWGRERLRAVLPAQCLRPLVPDKWQPAGAVTAMVVSILLGAATHVGWDGFTHPHGWAVERLPILASSVGSWSGHQVRVCRILWYASSFGGVVAVFLTYRRAVSPQANLRKAAPTRAWVEALFVGVLVIPIELIHDLAHDRAGSVLVALLSALLVGGVLWRSQAQRAAVNPDPTT